jgi:translocation and assembly module TamA
MRLNRHLGICGAALLLGVASLGGPATADDRDMLTGPDPAATAQPGAALDLAIAYATEFSPIEDDTLAGLIAATSQLKALEGRPTATFTGLTRRAEADMERFGTVLRSQGYYDGKVSFAIDGKAVPATVTVTISPGERYRLAAYEIVYADGVPPAGVARIAPGDIGIGTGMPAEAKPIADAQGRLIDTLQDQGRPFARVTNRIARIDRPAKTMTVTLSVDAGPPATFGPLTVTGLETLDEEFVRGKVPWRQGERFDRSALDELRTRLLGLDLFTSVKTTAADAVGADGSLPVTLALVEGPRRSIGAGVAWSTSDGFVLDVFWEHRNLFGTAEKLRLSGTVGDITQRAAASFRKPDMFLHDQDLLADLAAINTNSDAFDETTISSFVGLERIVTENWRISGGSSFELSQVTDNRSTETVQLFGLPLKATRDDRDNILNPTRGSVLGFEVTPYGGHGVEGLAFALGRIATSGYLALDDRRRHILAARGRVASLVGEATAAIPANKRLYAGGGGSIRGYEFQKAGPLDSENDPVGGRSLVELGVELRLRVTEEIGIVPFVEGGNVYDDIVPDLSTEPFWAAGLGLRYFTAIGPARVDIAFPINRRDNVDDRFQLYFSLGQAF